MKTKLYTDLGEGELLLDDCDRPATLEEIIDAGEIGAEVIFDISGADVPDAEPVVEREIVRWCSLAQLAGYVDDSGEVNGHRVSDDVSDWLERTLEELGETFDDQTIDAARPHLDRIDSVAPLVEAHRAMWSRIHRESEGQFWETTGCVCQITARDVRLRLNDEEGEG